MRRAIRLILVVLLACVFVLMLWAPGPHMVLATDYGTYDNLLLDTFAGHIIALWPLNETAGTTANDISGNGRNGTFSGVTLDQIDGAGPTFGRAGLWDDINDYTNVFSSSLASVWNEKELTISIWIKVYDSNVWSSATDYLTYFNGNGYYNIYRTSNAKISCEYKANNITKYCANFDSGSPTGWINLITTASYSGDALKIFMGGTQQGTTTTGLGEWSGALITASISQASGPFYGYLQQVLILDYPASTDDIAIISDPDPILPTPTPTNTPTATSTATATNTPRPPQMIATLQNGNEWELDYSITAGDIGQFIPPLILVAFILVALFLKLVRR